jgi:hypothetical protein
MRKSVIVLLLLQMTCLVGIAKPKAGVTWYSSWEAGLKQAQATQKPILLVSAAPHCHNVSGMW